MRSPGPECPRQRELPPAESSLGNGSKGTTSECVSKENSQNTPLGKRYQPASGGQRSAIRVEPWSLCFTPCFGVELFLFYGKGAKHK